MGKARQRLVSIIYARPIAIFSKVSKLMNFEIFFKEEWVVFDRIMKFTYKFMSKINKDKDYNIVARHCRAGDPG